ncbi:MAG: hypothetical protein QXE05_08675 [Nitrososphaeria archaeon]
MFKKVAVTRVMERSIYHNCPLMVFYETSCLRGLKHIVTFHLKMKLYISSNPYPLIMHPKMSEKRVKEVNGG